MSGHLQAFWRCQPHLSLYSNVKSDEGVKELMIGNPTQLKTRTDKINREEKYLSWTSHNITIVILDVKTLNFLLFSDLNFKSLQKFK